MKARSHFLPLIPFIVSIFFISCSKKVIHQHEEWEDYFKQNDLTGNILWHNYYGGTFDVYDFPNVRKQVLPAETFHIFLALAGLETGTIKDTNMTIRDSSGLGVPENLTMAQAFRENNKPYFQWVAEKIGKKRIQYWLDSTFYGNKTIGPDLTDFWFNNTLNISPDEQVGLMERLYQGKLSYQKRTRDLVKDLLRKETVRYDTLYYQYGMGAFNNQKIGWLMGWLKRKEDPYFFAIRTEADPGVEDLEAKHINILFRILKEKGFVDDAGRLK